MRICELATLNTRKQHAFCGGDDSLDALTTPPGYRDADRLRLHFANFRRKLNANATVIPE